jgi:hypothetical protein
MPPVTMLPFAPMHPKALKSMKPEERPKTEAPKIDRSAPSLKVMREKVIENKPSAKEVSKYFLEVIERLTADKEKEEDAEH